MTERGIPICGDLIPATMDGRKTQTRRVVKMHHRVNCPWAFDENDDSGYEWVEAEPELSAHDYRQPCRCIVCPYGQAGDRLYVKETRASWSAPDGYELVCYPATKTAYRVLREESGQGDIVDHEWDNIVLPDEDWATMRKISSRYFPKWAARMWLEITGIRVERVQDITADDVKCEGCGGALDHENGPDAIAAFAALWDTLNAKRGYSWESNPWVWVIEWKRILDATDS